MSNAELWHPFPCAASGGSRIQAEACWLSQYNRRRYASRSGPVRQPYCGFSRTHALLTIPPTSGADHARL